MQSHWIIIFKASNSGTFIKKIEHFLGKKLVDIQIRNDYAIGGEKYSCIDCFVAHSSPNWEAIVKEVFHLISKFSIQWEIYFLDTEKCYSGKLDYQQRENNGGYSIEGPSNFRLIEWSIKKDQAYKRLW